MKPEEKLFAQGHRVKGSGRCISMPSGSSTTKNQTSQKPQAKSRPALITIRIFLWKSPPCLQHCCGSWCKSLLCFRLSLSKLLSVKDSSNDTVPHLLPKTGLGKLTVKSDSPVFVNKFLSEHRNCWP